MQRRQVLRAGGALLAGTAGVVATTRPARASHTSAKPDHVTLTYDEERLHEYRPRLAMADADRKKLIGLYGWIAQSGQFNTDAYVYWAKYSHQDGVTSFDSHIGDHEPVYVFVDDASGEVDTVVASIYHWTAGKGTPDLDGSHPLLEVISPWHHYTATTANGQLFEVDDLHGTYERWLDEGLEEDIAFGVVVNPWTMLSRAHWWQDDIGTFSLTATEVAIYRAIGIGEAGEI